MLTALWTLILMSIENPHSYFMEKVREGKKLMEIL